MEAKATQEYLLPRSTMIGWGLGTLCPVILFTAVNTLLLRYLTDIVGISAALGAGLIAMSKIYDAFADPAVGIISDRSKFKNGRRRPFVLIGGFLMAISVILLFWMPADFPAEVRPIYMGVILLFYATAYSIYNVPYIAMSAEITTNYHQRSELMTYRVYSVGLATIIASSLGPFLLDQFGGGQIGHLAMALVFAPIILASGLICYYATKSAPFTTKPAHSTHNFMAQVRLAIANKPFFILILVKLLGLTALASSAIKPYFFTRILGLSDVYFGYYALCLSVTMIVTQPFWYWVSRRIGKKACFLIALTITLPLYLSWLFVSHGEPLVMILLRGVLLGLSAGGTILMGQSLLPDTMEYDYLTTGMRREGTFAGFYTTVEKIASAAGVAVVGAILGAAGYIQSRGINVVQPPEALEAIRYLMSVFPAVMASLSFVLLLFYGLTAEKLDALRKAASH